MSEERKKALWPWFAALLIGLPVLYVASFGPACWVADHHEPAWKPVWEIYYPLAAVAERGPVLLSRTLMDYGTWGSEAGIIPISIELSAQASYTRWRRQ